MEIQSKFVLMEHKTLRKGHDHEDLRFKIPNSNNWDSFALPKSVPQGSEKKMIIRTTIHSESNALYTGSIEQGEYGAGNISLKDSGTCTIYKYEPNKHIVIKFNGKILNGIYHFLNLKNLRKGEKNQFWFFKGNLK